MAKNKNLKRQLAIARSEIEELKTSMDSSSYVSPSGGFYNADNGFGPDTDPTFGTIWLPPYEFTFNELINMYQNPLVYRVINLHANDGTRKGLELVSKDNNDKARDIQQEMDERFNWLSLMKKMIAMRHAFGGGVLFADVDDGREPEEPLNENRVRKVWSFQPVEAYYAHPVSQRPLFRDEKPGRPMHYQIQLQAWGESKTFVCHESRLIRFPSYEADDVISQSQRVRRRTWPFSTTQLIYDAVKRYGIGMQSESQLLQGFTEDVFKVSGLKQMKDLEGFRTFIREQMLLKNSLRARIVGAEDSLEKIATPTTGMGEITKDQRRDIGMVTSIPVPILFSEESGDLGGSTLSESRQVWFDKVESDQNNTYTPCMMDMARIVSYETGWALDDVSVFWNSLERTSPLDQAQLEREVAEKDVLYVEKLGANEVDILDKRWGSGKFSSETPDFDRDEFEAELEEAAEEEAEQARQQLEALQNNGENEEQEEPEENTIEIEDEE